MAENDTLPTGDSARVESASGFITAPRLSTTTLLVAFGLFLLAYIPTLLSQGNELWARSHYQFFPLAILGSVALAVRAWRTLSAQDLAPCSSRTVKTLLLTSFVFLGAGVAARTGWFGAVSLLTLITALIAAAGGPTLFRAMIPSLLMLSLLIYPPLHLDGDLVLSLRQFAVWASGALLDVLGMPHFVLGNTIEIRGHKLLVEEACSGINSVFFIGAVSLFHGLWRKRNWMQIVSLMLAAFSFVLLGNVIRIAAGAVLKYRFEIDILSGWKHEAAGLIIFTAALGLVLNFDRLLFEFFAPLPARNAKLPVAAEASPRTGEIIGLRHLAGRLPFKALMASAVAFAGAGTLHGALILSERHAPGTFAFRKFPDVKPSATFLLPDQFAGWNRMTNSQAGPIERETSLEGKPLHSRQWAYQKGRMLLWLSLDYPYTDRHDLTYCYKMKGWEFDRSAESNDVKAPEAVVELDMAQKPLKKNGYLTFTQFFGDGRWYGGALGRLMDRVGHGPVYQLQAVVARTATLTPQEKQTVRAFFDEAKKQLSAQVVAQMEEKT